MKWKIAPNAPNSDATTDYAFNMKKCAMVGFRFFDFSWFKNSLVVAMQFQIYFILNVICIHI